jgi:hypothetical protein
MEDKYSKFSLTVVNVGALDGKVAITIPEKKVLFANESAVYAFSRIADKASVVDSVLLSPDNPSGALRSLREPYVFRILSSEIMLAIFLILV